MKKIIVCLALAFALIPAVKAQVERPKLVVGVVVDQMRWDYLYYYYDQYGEGGLRRLLSEGYSYQDCQIPYMPSVTAIGHSSVYTGSVPSLTGIAGNYFAIDDKSVYCCADPTVRSVGSDSREGQMSPRNMWATTIGDQLRIATDYKSRVIGVALKDRAAILPAGHSASAAYWWDTSAAQFVSSTFYTDKLPDWVQKLNKSWGIKPRFDLKTSSQGVSVTFRMAEAALENEHLGQGEATDMLCVSVSSTDAIGHKFSTRGKENKDVYMTLDRELATFLSTLDRQVGRGNYLLFLTADHGAAHNFNQMQSHRIPGGGWNYKQTVKDVNAALNSQFGFEPVMWEDNYQLYLNDSLIAAHGVEKQKIVDAAISYLRGDKMFAFIVDNEHASDATVPEPIKSKIINGYCHQRSGEITIVPRAGYFGTSDTSANYKGTSHGEWNPYDAHIPFVLMGWHVSAGESNTPCSMTDIAPTVCSMLHIQMPNSCVGRSVRP